MRVLIDNKYGCSAAIRILARGTVYSMVQKIGQHAVYRRVSPGLLSARVLADFFENVTVVEREHSARAAARDHNPRGQHAHPILARGGQILTPLFPGFIEELVAGGAFQADMGAAARCYQFGGYNVHTEQNATLAFRRTLTWIGICGGALAERRLLPE